MATPAAIPEHGLFKDQKIMLKIHTVILFTAGLLALGAVSGCSNNADPDAATSESRDGAVATAPELAPSKVFIDLDRAGSRIVAVGESGAIRVSDDNGDSWQAVTSGVDSTLTAVTFVSEQNGWAAGHDGVLLRTHDGGDQWVRVDLTGQIEPGQALMAVAFDANNQGVIVGPDKLLLTTADGGESWVRERLAARLSSSELNGAAMLESGHLLIVTDRSEILSRAKPDAEWQVARQGHKSLLGVIGLGGSEALAFGGGGTVLHSSDGGVNWAEVKSASKAGYFGGSLLSDGSVILVGSEGIVARRSAGGEVFYPEVELPLGALTAVAEGEHGRLLLTGIQGVGYQQDNQYWFHGVENGVTGQMVARSLLRRVELDSVFRLMEAGSRYYSRPQAGGAVEWVEISLSAAATEDDALTPRVFNEMGEFVRALQSASGLPVIEPRSLWDGRHFNYLVLQGPYGHTLNYPIVPDKPLYSDTERPYLERRLQQAALLERGVGADYRTVTVFADVPSQVVARGDGAGRDKIRSFLSDLADASGEEPRAFQVSGIETIRLEEVDRNPGAEEQPDAVDVAEPEKITGRTDYLYVISRDEGNSYRCEKSDTLRLADRLAGYLKLEGAPGPVLSVSDVAKLNHVSRKDENWKWYTTSDYSNYGNEVYRLWNQSYCLNPLAVVFGPPEQGAQSDKLQGLLDQFNDNMGPGNAPENFELKTYRVTRVPI